MKDKRIVPIQIETLVSIDEATDVILKFFGSEQYNKILNSLENTKQSGFTTGLGIAMILIQLNCQKYAIISNENGGEGNNEKD